MNDTRSDFVRVASYPFLSIAQVAQAALEAEGIPAFFENAEIVNADWLLGNAVGDVKLLVPVEYAAAARDVLATKRLNESRRRDATTEGDERERCLACDAPLPAAASSCAVCGWSFADNEGRVTDVPEEAAPKREPLVDVYADEPAPAYSPDEGLIRKSSWMHHIAILMLLMILLAVYAHSTGYDVFGWFNAFAK